MTTRTLRRAIMACALFAVGVLAMLGWGLQRGQRAAAETAGQTELAIAIDLNGDSIDDCDTIAATGTSSTCTVAGSGTFGVKERVRSLDGMPDNNGNSIKEFAGMTWTLNYTSGGLVRVNSGMAQVLAGACTVGSSATSESAGATSFTCHGSASNFIGAVLRIDFSCSGTGSRTTTMVAAPDLTSQTWLHAENTHAQTVSKDMNETLTINCVAAAAVGGIAKLPGVAGAAPLATEDSSSSVSVGLVAGIAAFATAITVLGGAAWRQRRKRLG